MTTSEPTEQVAVDLLRTPEAGGRVIRGGVLRGVGYGAGLLFGALTSVFLLRHLGVADFGRYATVAALLGIVSGVTDAGLTAVGSRELAVRAAAERRHLLANLVALRIVLTTAGVLLAAAFAVVAGYERTLVWGTLLGGLGVVLVNTQATAMMPLAVELRLGTVTLFEVLKQALTLAGVVLLVALGASLLPFFVVQVGVGLVVLALTPLAVGQITALRPSLDLASARTLVRESLPVAVALTMNVVYFRVLVVMVSLLATATATGLFGTSFRIFEILIGLPTLVLSVALPLLAVAGREDEERLAYALQRMTEVALLVSVLLVVATEILAAPLIRLLAGSEFDDAAPVLRIQAAALIPVFLGQTWQLGLVAIRRQRGMAIANGAALALVLVLGAILIPLKDETGAAIAAVAAECALALLLLGFLARARRRLVPSFASAWKVAAAGGAAAAAMLVPGLPAVATLALAVALYAAVAFSLRAVPPELAHALRR